jgi:hypothetical protein
MFKGETADAMMQLVQKENLAILAFVSLSLWALAGVATLATLKSVTKVSVPAGTTMVLYK